MHPISALLCEAYDRLFAEGEVRFPLYEKQRAAIDTIVKTVNASYFGFVRFPTTQAATDTIDYVATDTWGNTSTSTRTIVIAPNATQ
jgi:hypothetical protein